MKTRFGNKAKCVSLIVFVEQNKNLFQKKKFQPIITIITLCPVLIILATIVVTVLTYRRLTSTKTVAIEILIIWFMLLFYGGLHLFAWKKVLMDAAPFFLG